MDDNILYFPGATTLDIPPERILEAAKGADLAGVIVVGWNKDDNLYLASSTSDVPELNWLLDVAKEQLLKTIR